MRWCVAAIIVLLTFLCGEIFRSAWKYNLIELEVCDESTMPPKNWICHGILFHARPTPEDVKEFNFSAGAQFPMYMENISKGEKLLERYLSFGLDINAQDQRSLLMPQSSKFTALHLMVMNADANRIQILLKHGAKTDVIDAQGRTPLNLAYMLQEKFPKRDFKEAIEILKSAKQ